MTPDGPRLEKPSVRTDAIHIEGPRPGPIATTFSLLFRFVWNGATAFGASCLGRWLAHDAGMSSRPLGVEACPILIAGLIGGLLLRTRPERRDRVAPFVALAIGAAAGLWLATRSIPDAALRWPIFIAPAVWASFAGAVLRR